MKEHVGHDGLRLYCYSESCIYERKRNDASLMARGLILDPDSKRVVAIPFTKSFNVGERADSIPDLPLETFEKLDGNRIFIFHHKGEWRCANEGQPRLRAGEMGGSMSVNGLFSKHLLASESAADLVSLQSRDRVKGHSGVY